MLLATDAFSNVVNENQILLNRLHELHSAIQARVLRRWLWQNGIDVRGQQIEMLLGMDSQRKMVHFSDSSRHLYSAEYRQMVTMLTWWMSMAWGHPFESQFVGHKSTIEVYPTHLEVSFDLEVPLPLVERAYQESGHPDKKEWLSGWIGDQQIEIEQNLWLDINLVRQSEWSEVEHSTPMWKEESKFLVFSTILTTSIDGQVLSLYYF